jgi:hypothetical protein
LGGLRRIVRMGGRSLEVHSVQCIDILIFSILLKNNPIIKSPKINNKNITHPHVTQNNPETKIKTLR